MQPTKLPDDLFADGEWQGADYAARVALLVERYRQAAALVLAGDRHASTLAADLRDVRERNAALVSEIERMYREKTQGADPGF